MQINTARSLLCDQLHPYIFIRRRRDRLTVNLSGSMVVKRQQIGRPIMAVLHANILKQAPSYIVYL